MDANSLPSVKDQKEKLKILIEVADVDKKLWALILTKGILHSDVQALCRNVCSTYEKIILNDHELGELQDIEYSLWKVHYRHIDEFRKKIKKTLVNDDYTKSSASESAGSKQRSDDIHVKGYKSFLSEATKFYQNLLRKIKRYYGFPEDFSFSKKDGNSISVEPKKMQKLQFLCHRFLVCLGDLARYTEQCEKSDAHKQNWSTAVTHYLEATRIWPHSGNPQNQLAVLAMYVGDEFLALYHCIRSLAVKEPFPDARNNLMLLFDRNRSSQLQFLSTEARFDFLHPSEGVVWTDYKSTNDLPTSKVIQAEQNVSTNLWPLFIRTMSCFFMKSSFKEFSFTFASTVKDLDLLMALDDEKLKEAMESYKQMGSARSGPFRSLQMVSIFIFVIEDLNNCQEQNDSKNKNDRHQFDLQQEAVTVAFIFMGRLANRCLKAKSLNSFPLLPALLIFSEWLVNILDKLETYRSNERSRNAMLYFFGAFGELVKRFDIGKGDNKPSGNVALWEDYELRGFAPLVSSHAPLDFSTHWDHANDNESGALCRVHRIVNAAIKLYPAECNNIQKTVEEPEQIVLRPNSSNVTSKPASIEEEEVILFKPLTRYNSAPLYSASSSNTESTNDSTVDPLVPADECLRRATSMLIAQNQAQGDTSSFQSDMTNFRRNKQESVEREVAEEISFSFNTNSSAGPPSLNAWVLDRGSLSIEKMKGRRDGYKPEMPPIEEVSKAFQNDLSVSDSVDSSVSLGHESVITHDKYPAYMAPTPSAPLLPDDAVWFNGSVNANQVNNVYNGNWAVSPQPIDYGLGIMNPTGGYSPTRRLTSSEWLRQYRENQNLDRFPSQVWPEHTYGALNSGNFYGHDVPRSGLFEQFGVPMAGNPLVYEEQPFLVSGFAPVYSNIEPRREKPYNGYQRPYGCGAVNEPEPLLQYLKEKEWLLQQDPTFRGPMYRGS